MMNRMRSRHSLLSRRGSALFEDDDRDHLCLMDAAMTKEMMDLTETDMTESDVNSVSTGADCAVSIAVSTTSSMSTITMRDMVYGSLPCGKYFETMSIQAEMPDLEHSQRTAERASLASKEFAKSVEKVDEHGFPSTLHSLPRKSKTAAKSAPKPKESNSSTRAPSSPRKQQSSKKLSKAKSNRRLASSARLHSSETLKILEEMPYSPTRAEKAKSQPMGARETNTTVRELSKKASAATSTHPKSDKRGWVQNERKRATSSRNLSLKPNKNALSSMSFSLYDDDDDDNVSTAKSAVSASPTKAGRGRSRRQAPQSRGVERQRSNSLPPARPRSMLTRVDPLYNDTDDEEEEQLQRMEETTKRGGARRRGGRRRSAVLPDSNNRQKSTASRVGN